MKEQKERARKASFHRTSPGESITTRTVRKVPRTEFLGYDALECEASVAMVGDARGDRVARQHEAGAFLEFTTDRTVFYPEGGGQVGDAGSAMFGDLNLFVVDTYRAGDQIAHLARVADGSTEELMGALASGPSGRLHVYRERRFSTMRNHTATHLLHAALRRVLGDHVAQAGSLVAPDRLRFDFHHFQAMKPGEVEEVERMVNEHVMHDLAVTDEKMPYKEAIKTGAMALFGEKYGDEVRVVSIESFSKELCGGTHLRRTGEIGPFFIRQETAVAAGVRRIEALTGSNAHEIVRRSLDDLGAVAALLRVTPAEIETRVRALLEENETLLRERKKAEARKAEAGASDALADATDIRGLRFVAATVELPDLNALRSYGDALRGKLGLGVALVCQTAGDKPMCLLVAGDSAIKERGVRADELAKLLAAALGIRGGGKPHMAQFGLPNASDFNRVRDFIRQQLEAS